MMTAVFALLYDLFMAPLAIAYGVMYHICVLALGYGYGLLALSVLTTLFLSPLRKKVAGIQEEERRLRRVIGPQLAAIKAESHGEERHLRVRRLYRRYAYHPVMSIRGMWGLVLQAPFIFAAYHMLSELSALRFASFWGIPSLAVADGLLPGGVNLLPFVMTAFNLAAALLSPGATRRETGQAAGIAALFLFLLYGAPSALLVYWTANNFLSLVETLLLRRKERAGGENRDLLDDVVTEETEEAAPAAGSSIPASWLVVYAVLLVSLPLAWGFSLRWRVEAAYSGQSPYYFVFGRWELGLALALFAAAAAGWRRKKTAWRRAGIAACALLAGFLIFGWASELRLRTLSGKLFIWTTLAQIAMAFLAWSVLCADLNRGLARLFGKEAERSGRILYWPALLALAGLGAVFAPMASFQSAPEVFAHSAMGVFRIMTPYFLCAVYVFLYLRVVLPAGAAARIGLFAAFLAVVCIAQSLLFPPLGIIDGNAFFPQHDGTRWGEAVRDCLAAALGVAVVWGAARFRVMRRFAFGLGLCAFSFLALGAWTVFASSERTRPDPVVSDAVKNESATTAAEADLPPYHHGLFSLSPDKPNVLILMFDMFYGGDIQRMLDSEPELAERLPGFVWYRDTLSDGNNTVLSFPAILGGPDYTPSAVNERTDGSLVAKVLRSQTELSGRFLDAGYAVAYFNVEGNLSHRDGKSLAERLGYHGAGLIEAEPSPIYARMARDAILPGGSERRDDTAAFLLSISLFRAAPNLLREGLVDLGLFDSDSLGDRVYEMAAVPYLMPGFLTADSPAPTFKIFATAFCHNPFLLGPDSLVPLERKERLAVNRSGLAHYYADRHAIGFVEEIVDWLRAHDVYDNTRIILVSDHDYKDDPHPYLSAKTMLLPYNIKPHALLMEKDFGAGGPLAISDQPMQGHDTPALACRGLPEIANPPPAPEAGAERTRRHAIAHANLASHTRERFTNMRIFTVTGSMFEAENWKDD